MSRCFPFPPPGYEKKASIKDEDILKKEKHREKKHKKEKREKEKRDNEEKRGTEGLTSKEKSKRKEKDRDKKKDKEKYKEKDKTSTSIEKRLPEETDHRNRLKLVQKECKVKDSSVSAEKKYIEQSSGYIGNKQNQNSHLAKDTGNSKLVQELEERIKDGDSRSANPLVAKFSVTQPKRDDGMAILAAKGFLENPAECKEEKEKSKKPDDRKNDIQGVRDEPRFGGNAIVQNATGMFQARVAGTGKILEKNAVRSMETKERTEENEGDEKRRDKQKDKEREKKERRMEKDRDKEKRRVEKAKKKIEQKNAELEKLKESNKDNRIGTDSIKISSVHKDINRDVAVDGNLKKRKDLETNGNLPAIESMSINYQGLSCKFQGPTSPSLPFTENGWAMGPCESAVPSASHSQGALNHLKFDNKRQNINGMIEILPNISHAKPMSSSTVQSEKIAVTPTITKLPHPDSKYLSQVYSAPKMEELSYLDDDQDWLCSNYDSQLKKPNMETEAEEVSLVWAETIQIESADIHALPYVVPF